MILIAYKDKIFYSIQRQIQSKVFWLASGSVLMYEYQSFENDTLFYRKPLARL